MLEVLDVVLEFLVVYTFFLRATPSQTTLGHAPVHVVGVAGGHSQRAALAVVNGI